MIELREVSHRWRDADRDILAIETLDIKAGESVFLYGPSGCGKSTLLGLVAGVLVPSEGSVALLGHELVRAVGCAARPVPRRPRRLHLPAVQLLPYLNVLDNVLLPCRFSGDARERAAATRRHAPQRRTALLRASRPGRRRCGRAPACDAVGRPTAARRRGART